MPVPTILIGWAVTRTAEAIVDCVTNRITAKAKARLGAKVRFKVSARSADA